MANEKKYLIVETVCQSSSFRNPEFQNFHKTFELPPPTTVMGLAGAALGKSPKQTQDFFSEGFEMGIAGNFKGKANDLWKYRKKDTRPASQYPYHFGSDVLTREVLFEASFVLVYGCPDHTTFNQLKDAFENPRYALTMGNSDSLAKISYPLAEADEKVDCEVFQDCVVDGNLLKEVLDASKDTEFSLRDGADPVSYDVPVEFSYQSDYGVRQVVRRKELSFITQKLYVKGLKRPAVNFKGQLIPIFSLNA